MQQEDGHKLPAISLLKDAKLLNRDHTFVRPHGFLSFAPSPVLLSFLHRSFSSARLESHMAVNNCSSCVHDAMDKLWFSQNVLFFQPDVLVSPQSKLTRPRSISPSKLPDINSHQYSKIQSSDENTNRQSVYNDERPAKLNIVIGQPIFQLQPPPRSTKILSHSSSPPNSKRRPAVKSCLSELENYELKGGMDLGFTFPNDRLDPHMMSMVSGLQKLGERDGEQEGKMRHVRRPYLSEAWLVDSPGSPLINLRVLPKTPDGADMKKHLKFWAHRVAMLVHDEP